MTEASEILVLGFGLLVMTAALIWRWRELAARARAAPVEAEVICPKSGSHVRLQLLEDEHTGDFIGVRQCSAHQAGAVPPCDQECARLLNLGIPIRDDGGKIT